MAHDEGTRGTGHRELSCQEAIVAAGGGVCGCDATTGHALSLPPAAVRRVNAVWRVRVEVCALSQVCVTGEVDEAVARGSRRRA